MKIAVLLLSYKKIDTFKKTIESIKNSTFQDFDLFVRIDNCNDLSISNKLIKISESYYPDASIVLREYRYGLDLNVIYSINEVFSKGYDGVFYVEDDIIYDKTALSTLINLYKWSQKSIPGKAGIITGWNHKNANEYYYNLHGLNNLIYSCSYAENEVGFTGQNPWGGLLTREFYDKCFDDIMRMMLVFLKEKRFNFLVYKKWMEMICYSSASSDLKYRTISRYNVEGWESNFDLCMLANDMYKVCLTNPRVKTIGIEGATSTSNMFIKAGLDKIETLNSEFIPEDFVLNEESKSKWFN